MYGLGAILYELLTAKAPFRGDTPMITMQAVLKDPAPPVRRLRPDAAYDLDVIVAKCLEKDPGRRYASAAALAEDLDRYLDNRPILARGIGPVERGRRWIARNPLAAGLIATLCLGFAVTFGFAVVVWRTAENERQARIEVQQANAEADRQRRQAVAALAIAETKQKDAEAAHAEAEAQSKIAQANAKQAETLLAITADSIDTVLVQFAVDPRFHDADYLRVRRKLLQNAMEFYRKLEQQKGNATFVVHRYARAGYLYGVLSRTLGETEHGNEHIARAIGIFETIFREHQYEPRWRLEYARMCLDQLDRADTDGSTYRISVPFYLRGAKLACDEAMPALDAAGQSECRSLLAKWKVLRAREAGRTKPEEELRLGLEVLPDVTAMLAAQGKTKTPDVVDLYGTLLLQLAKASARCGEEQAAYFFDDADEHYRRAVAEWFPSHRTTSWHCKYALSRQAHGMYFDAIGLKNLCDQAFASTRRILETAVSTSPEVTPYCVEIAQAYLEIIRFIHKHYPDEDPRSMVDLLDSSLSPYWNIGPPSDRARSVLAESKMLLAKWCEDRHQHIEAGNAYTAGYRAWMHGFKEHEGGIYRNKGQLCLSRSALQFALGNRREHSVHNISVIETHDDITGGTWYNIARAWCTLAQNDSPNPEADLAKALEALDNADRDGFFQAHYTLRHYREAKELDPVRGRFEPKNLVPNALPK